MPPKQVRDTGYEVRAAPPGADLDNTMPLMEPYARTATGATLSLRPEAAVNDNRLHIDFYRFNRVTDDYWTYQKLLTHKWHRVGTDKEKNSLTVSIAEPNLLQILLPIEGYSGSPVGWHGISQDMAGFMVRIEELLTMQFPGMTIARVPKQAFHTKEVNDAALNAERLNPLDLWTDAYKLNLVKERNRKQELSHHGSAQIKITLRGKEIRIGITSIKHATCPGGRARLVFTGGDYPLDDVAVLTLFTAVFPALSMHPGCLQLGISASALDKGERIPFLYRNLRKLAWNKITTLAELQRVCDFPKTWLDENPPAPPPTVEGSVTKLARNIGSIHGWQPPRIQGPLATTNNPNTVVQPPLASATTLPPPSTSTRVQPSTSTPVQTSTSTRSSAQPLTGPDPPPTPPPPDIPRRDERTGELWTRASTRTLSGFTSDPPPPIPGVRDRPVSAEPSLDQELERETILAGANLLEKQRAAGASRDLLATRQAFLDYETTDKVRTTLNRSHRTDLLTDDPTIPTSVEESIIADLKYWLDPSKFRLVRCYTNRDLMELPRDAVLLLRLECEPASYTDLNRAIEVISMDPIPPLVGDRLPPLLGSKHRVMYHYNGREVPVNLNHTDEWIFRHVTDPSMRPMCVATNKNKECSCPMCLFDRTPLAPLIPELGWDRIRFWAVQDVHTDVWMQMPAERRHDQAERLRSARPKSPCPRGAPAPRLERTTRVLLTVHDRQEYLDILDFRDSICDLKEEISGLKFLLLASLWERKVWNQCLIESGTFLQYDNHSLTPRAEVVARTVGHFDNRAGIPLSDNLVQKETRLELLKHKITVRLKELPEGVEEAFYDEQNIRGNAEDRYRPLSVLTVWREHALFRESAIFKYQSKRKYFSEIMTEINRIRDDTALADQTSDARAFRTKMPRDPNLRGPEAQRPAEIINARLLRAAAEGRDASWLRPGDGATGEYFKPYLQNHAEFSGKDEDRVPLSQLSYRFCSVFNRDGVCTRSDCPFMHRCNYCRCGPTRRARNGCKNVWGTCCNYEKRGLLTRDFSMKSRCDWMCPGAWKHCEDRDWWLGKSPWAYKVHPESWLALCWDDWDVAHLQDED